MHARRRVARPGRPRLVAAPAAPGRWEYDWDDPMRPWRVDDPAGRLHLVLTARFDKHTVTGRDERGSEVHQVFGTWSGRLVTDDGSTVEFPGLQGFAEEARQRW
ncbi:MAG TPA: DUF2804 family protein [Acidimicrobiales bacterium]